MGQTNSTHGQTILQGQLDVTLCSELASGLFFCFSKMWESKRSLLLLETAEGVGFMKMEPVSLKVDSVVFFWEKQKVRGWSSFKNFRLRKIDIYYGKFAAKNVYDFKQSKLFQVNVHFSGRVKRSKAYLTFSAVKYIIKIHFLVLQCVGKSIS